MTTHLLAMTETWPDLIVFVVSAVMILLGAWGVVIMSNPVHAALSLVLTLFGVAVLFVEQGAQFLAAVQVIVYAGAIVVLFLFVIMFLGVDRKENVGEEPLKGQRPLAFLLVVVAIAGILTLLVRAHWVTGAHAVAGTDKGVNVARIGQSVFTTYLYAFEATAALLVIAVVGAVVLARRPSVEAQDDPGVDEGADARPAAPDQAGRGPGAPEAEPGAVEAGGETAEPVAAEVPATGHQDQEVAR